MLYNSDIHVQSKRGAMHIIKANRFSYKSESQSYKNHWDNLLEVKLCWTGKR